MSQLPHVDAALYAFFAPDFAADGPVGGTVDDLAAIVAPLEKIGPTRIEDARELQGFAQRDPSFSEARFFDEHGFVLLHHETAVRDWEVDPFQPEPGHDAIRIYHPEAEALIRARLLPGRRLEIVQGPPSRRGPGTANPGYATGVHQDFAFGPDDYEEALRAFTTPEISGWWRQRFDRDDVVGFLTINLWRPVYLDGPLHHMPLAVCEPSSVRREDCVPLSLMGLTATGLPTKQLGLRRADGQRWYYYPRMTVDEVLAFKNFQFFKDDPPAGVEACFHSAFEEPGAPAGLPERQSCEHRVSVFVLAD